jgi:cbb3-type cytochrome oxidase cytochrome c subunit
VKSGCVVFVAVLIALGASWTGFVLGPTLQLGRETLTTMLSSTDPYPVQRTGEATLGLQVYRANGCAACHTEQVRQSGVVFDVVLTAAGKKPMEVTNLMAKLKLYGLTKEEADAANDQLTAVGAKAETHLAATGTDISLGWGARRSVAADFLYDCPVQLGNLRVGPDLADIGTRLADVNVQLLHLYAPKAVVNNSTMPSFAFLFDVRKIVAGTPSSDALKLPPAFAPAADYEVVPKTEAKQLVAYLLSLHANVPLSEAPFTPVTAKP